MIIVTLVYREILGLEHQTNFLGLENTAGRDVVPKKNSLSG
jgi:hypothetical protein